MTPQYHLCSGLRGTANGFHSVPLLRSCSGEDHGLQRKKIKISYKSWENVFKTAKNLQMKMQKLCKQNNATFTLILGISFLLYANIKRFFPFSLCFHLPYSFCESSHIWIAMFIESRAFHYGVNTFWLLPPRINGPCTCSHTFIAGIRPRLHNVGIRWDILTDNVTELWGTITKVLHFGILDYFWNVYIACTQNKSVVYYAFVSGTLKVYIKEKEQT